MRTSHKMYLTFILSSACIFLYQYHMSIPRISAFAQQSINEVSWLFNSPHYTVNYIVINENYINLAEIISNYIHDFWFSLKIIWKPKLSSTTNNNYYDFRFIFISVLLNENNYEFPMFTFMPLSINALMLYIYPHIYVGYNNINHYYDNNNNNHDSSSNNKQITNNTICKDKTSLLKSFSIGE